VSYEHAANFTNKMLEWETHKELVNREGVEFARKISATVWQISIYVQDLGLFQERVAWKANDTTKKWDEHDRFLNEI